MSPSHVRAVEMCCMYFITFLADEFFFCITNSCNFCTRIGAFSALIRKKIKFNQQHSINLSLPNFFRNPFQVSEKDRVSRHIFQIIYSLYAGYFVKLNKYELKNPSKFKLKVSVASWIFSLFFLLSRAFLSLVLQYLCLVVRN